MNFPFERISRHERLPYFKGLELDEIKNTIVFGDKQVKLIRTGREYLMIWALIRARGGHVPFSFLKRWVLNGEELKSLTRSEATVLSTLKQVLNKKLLALTDGVPRFEIKTTSGFGYYLEYLETKKRGLT
jgi:DNA-binding response OmpR family regulator